MGFYWIKTHHVWEHGSYREEARKTAGLLPAFTSAPQTHDGSPGFGRGAPPPVLALVLTQTSALPGTHSRFHPGWSRFYPRGQGCTGVFGGQGVREQKSGRLRVGQTCKSKKRDHFNGDRDVSEDGACSSNGSPFKITGGSSRSRRCSDSTGRTELARPATEALQAASSCNTSPGPGRGVGGPLCQIPPDP